MAHPLNDLERLEVLKLAYNNITGKTLIPIADGLKKLIRIKYVDLSFNALGRTKPNEKRVGVTLAELLNENSIRHIDLSYN